VKGRFFDRLDAKLDQLARFDSNELVSIDLQAMATALFPGQEETVRCQTCAPRPKGAMLRGAASTVCDFRGWSKSTYRGGDIMSV
jgi:hypothetical protein